MKRKITYDQVQELYSKTVNREFAIQVGVLLQLVDDFIEQHSLDKDDFEFTEYDAGYILVSGFREPVKGLKG